MRDGAVQIAGVVDAEDAALIVECGVDFLGFPLGPGVRPGDCTAEAATRIIESLPAEVEPVLITYLIRPDEVAALARRIGAPWVQLHGEIQPQTVSELRHIAPELRLAKSLIVREGRAAGLEQTLEDFAPHVDAFLTDTYDPSTGASGATGRPHDWAVSRSLAAISPWPLVLAGGLTPENVGRAILEVGPSAVDVHTGVEGADGRKVRDLVSRFVAAARAAFHTPPEDRPGGGRRARASRAA